MKCVILAGGRGTRLAEETERKPKPMVPIGERPILWHIMKLYSHFGVNDFVICLGYLGYHIKEYFSNYSLHNADVTIDMVENATTFHATRNEPWRVTLVETGLETMTGGRLAKVRSYLDPGEPFCMTYGDGVADLDVAKVVAHHRRLGRKATITCVRPPARFGRVGVDGDKATFFQEKPAGESGLINGGFFVLEPAVLDYCVSDDTIWENEPLHRLAAEDQLSAWVHDGYWQPMDTLRDRNALEDLWASGQAPWKLW